MAGLVVNKDNDPKRHEPSVRDSGSVNGLGEIRTGLSGE